VEKRVGEAWINPCWDLFGEKELQHIMLCAPHVHACGPTSEQGVGERMTL